MSDETRYALLYSEYESTAYIRIQFGKILICTLCLPLFAFVFCVSYSVLFHFEMATYTHCHVDNLLPSISAAIGNFTPQRQVWQSAIALHALPRFYIALMYYRHHQNVLYPNDRWLGLFALFFNLIENIALIVLSFWTSSEHYSVHKKAFVTFILMSEFYMIIMCVLQDRWKKQHRISLRMKKHLMTANVFCILIATYSFMRHNSFCEPYVYTVFAMAEYLVVLTNMAFHSTAYLDFRNKDLVFYKYGFALTER